LLIAGTGDYAIAAAFFLQEQYELLGFAEEAAYRKLPDLLGLPIYNLEDVEAKFKPGEIEMLVAVGPNKVNTVRERLYLQVKQWGYHCISYIHPTAYVWNKSTIGENSFIFPNCVVEPYATVGNNCVLWSGAILAHHSAIMDHCFLAPGAKVSGRSTIKPNCFIGINATVRDNVVIAEKCIVGGGAVIKKNTVPNGVYSANPGTLVSEDSLNVRV
jgi:sugar O-acyltransferase (sialic acid O-acetyltransferase NeuD family)